MPSHLHRGLASAYVLAVTAVLGFGIKEATASPAATTASASTCTWWSCKEYCDSMGWHYDWPECGEYGCECRVNMCGDTFC
jgi:hypothetical protein